MKMLYEKDSKSKALKSRRIAVIGYGSQGHAQAQNLRESGYDVIVSDLKGTANFKLAKTHGFKPVSAAEAAGAAEVIQILLPDQIQADIYRDSIASRMTKGKALVFSHGFNIHFDQIVPPADVDVFMVAPKGPGHLVRRVYQDGGGVPALIAVQQNATGKARELALEYACGIGAGRAGIIETTFAEETETDLFGEQVVLCGGLTELIRAGFDTLVGAGYKPEVAYFECLHEVKLIVDLIYEGGIARMRDSISDTAEYGDLVTGRRIINENVRAEMKKVLAEIQDGSFAGRWLMENKVGRPHYSARKRQDSEHQIEKVGARLRKMMSWLKK